MRNGSAPDAAPRLVLIDHDTDRMIRLAEQLVPHTPWTQSPRFFSSLEAFVAGMAPLKVSAVLADAGTLATDAQDIENAVGRLAKAAQGALVVVLNRGEPLSVALNALQAGAHDVLAHDLAPTEMGRRLAELAHRHLRGSARLPGSGAAEPLTGAPRWISVSAAARRAFADIKGIAPSSAPAFISGAKGVGKTYAAKMIHAHSARAEGPLIFVSAATEDGASGLTSQVLEAAHGGTLVVEDVERLCDAEQALLLQLLQADQGFVAEQGRDIRLIATSPLSGAELLHSGALREDVFYRLSVLPLVLSSLADCPEDIVPLARHFLSRANAVQGKAFARFSARAERLLRATEWPGNAGQLQFIVSTAVADNMGEVLGEDMIRQALDAVQPSPPAPRRKEDHVSSHLAQITPMWIEEQRIIERALALCGGNISQAAAALEISPSTIYRKKQFWAEQQQAKSNAA